MGKRSSFQHTDKNFWRTPFEAVVPLIPHLDSMEFDEPCCGEMDLVRHLEAFGLTCGNATDIRDGFDALKMRDTPSDRIITNPPWERSLLHPLIDHLRQLRPTWMLIDADWAFTKQAIPYMEFCERFVAVGRVKWVPDSPHAGKDNCAWYLFREVEVETRFVAQMPRDQFDRIARRASRGEVVA